MNAKKKNRLKRNKKRTPLIGVLQCFKRVIEEVILGGE